MSGVPPPSVAASRCSACVPAGSPLRRHRPPHSPQQHSPSCCSVQTSSCGGSCARAKDAATVDLTAVDLAPLLGPAESVCRASASPWFHSCVEEERIMPCCGDRGLWGFFCAQSHTRTALCHCALDNSCGTLASNFGSKRHPSCGVIVDLLELTVH